MPGGIDLVTARGFAIALLIGALVGVEREKHKAAEQISGAPGLRTFILLAECGALAAWLARGFGAPWLLAAALLAAALLLAAGYLRADPRLAPALGMTTESAALAVFLLGAVAVEGNPALAAALGIATSALLAYKQPLHRVVTGIGTEDFYAALRLLIATFIVLPLLPDRPVDPWGSVNPAKLWLLVILISALSFAGYLAARRLGPGRGAALTGVAGGVVSSTAVTLSFARRSREEDGAASAAFACGIVLSWAVMFPRVVAMVALVNPGLSRPLLVPFAAMGLAAAVAAWLLYLRTAAAGTGGGVPLRSPFSLREAVRFALVFAAVLVVVAVASRHLPGRGLLLVAGVAGLTDVDAITLSMAEHARRGGDEGNAVAAIAVAAIANTAVKGALAAVLGSPPLRRWALAAAAAILAAGAASLAIPR